MNLVPSVNWQFIFLENPILVEFPNYLTRKSYTGRITCRNSQILFMQVLLGSFIKSEMSNFSDTANKTWDLPNNLLEYNSLVVNNTDWNFTRNDTLL